MLRSAGRLLRGIWFLLAASIAAKRKTRRAPGPDEGVIEGAREAALERGVQQLRQVAPILPATFREDLLRTARDNLYRRVNEGEDVERVLLEEVAGMFDVAVRRKFGLRPRQRHPMEQLLRMLLAAGAGSAAVVGAAASLVQVLALPSLGLLQLAALLALIVVGAALGVWVSWRLDGDQP